MASRLCQVLKHCAARAAALEAGSAQPALSRAYCLGLSSTGTLNRFYDKASIAEAPGVSGYWNVLLDGRRVKTPNKDVLKVPSQLLAVAIAAEFQYQAKDYVRPITQPLFRLQWQAQHAAFSHQELIDRMLQYVDSDPVCMRTPDDVMIHKLKERQDAEFGSILAWAEPHFGVKFEVSASLYGCEQPPEVALAYADFLQRLPYAQLLALSELAGACKSLLIAFAVHGRHTSVDQAVRASRLEEDAQMEQYGLVEGGHDLDAADLRTRVGGCALFMLMHALDAVHSDAYDRKSRDIDKAMDVLKGLGF
eukprot:jgi/Ulvmu1/6376/UM003_0004.1